MDKYTELMARHAVIVAEWMRWVEAQKATGTRLFYSAGVILGKHGDLAMRGKDLESGVVVLELVIAPGEDAVRVTFADPDLANA